MATYASQNLGAKKPERIGRGIMTAVGLYGVWWIVALILTFTVGPAAVRLITGSGNQEVIAGAVLYLTISIPMIPPMAVIVVLRNTLQGVGHLFMPLFCSSLELIGKIIFAVFIVPVYGYTAVCICEPTTWVICMVFIVVGTLCCRKEFQKAEDVPKEVKNERFL